MSTRVKLDQPVHIEGFGGEVGDIYVTVDPPEGEGLHGYWVKDKTTGVVVRLLAREVRILPDLEN